MSFAPVFFASHCAPLQITPVTSKELALALELLQHCQALYPWNPHSKGFTVLNKLVVETALPLVQVPALKYIRLLVRSSAFNTKSFRKSGGVSTLGKWLKEQRGAARVISARATLEVLDVATRLIAVSPCSPACVSFSRPNPPVSSWR